MAKKIIVYSTSSCPYCKMLKTFLTENNISFEDIDIGIDKTAAQEMMEKSGQMGVPVIDIDGKIIVGFNRKDISRELSIK